MEMVGVTRDARLKRTPQRVLAAMKLAGCPLPRSTAAGSVHVTRRSARIGGNRRGEVQASGPTCGRAPDRQTVAAPCARASRAHVMLPRAARAARTNSG